MYVAATPSSTNNLSLFRTALVSVMNEQPVSDSLKEHVLEILTQALELLRNPESLPTSVIPEALELAVQISKYDDFQKELEGNHQEFIDSPVKAKELLSKVDSTFAYFS